MKQRVIFLLNLPFTLTGVVPTILSFPYSIKIVKNPLAFVIRVKSFWWGFYFYKYARALTIGHVILLSSKEMKNDYQHEIIHVRQCERYPFIYPFLYLYQSIKHGYRNNRFEDEAYVKSKSFYNGVQQGI